MGENKGHGDKAPNYPQIDEMGSAANRAGRSAGNQQSAGKQQDRQQDIGQQQQSSIQQQGSKQQDASNRQDAGGQRQNRQHGGQHASGGTPALDDLNADLDSRDRGSLGSASQQKDQTSGWDGKQDKKR